jgi:hypothetical protein
MNSQGYGYPYGNGVPVNRLIGDSNPADRFKVNEWLEGADKAQCQWAINYLWGKVSDRTPEAHFLDWSEQQYPALVEWLLCGEGNQFDGIWFPFTVNLIRRDGATLFAKARNAWNQKVNRERKAAEAASTVVLDPKTKQKLHKLASEHGVSEEEYLSILVDLVSERRNANKNIAQQRKKIKRAVIGSDIGFSDVVEEDKKEGIQGYTGAL